MTTPVIAPASRPPSFTAPGSYPPAVSRRVLESGVAAWSAATVGMGRYWLDAAARRKTPWEAAGDGVRWWSLMQSRERPRWTLPNEIVFEASVARLRDFSGGSRDRVVPTLVLPPQAGHDSCIVDYSRDQSQMRTILAAGLTRAYSLDWIGATQATKDASIEEYLAIVERAVDEVSGGEPINVVGDCQGGWLAAIYAALHPEQVHTLTIAGAPIDFHGDAVIHDYVEHFGRMGDLSFYETVVAMGGGVLKGKLMLNGFITIKPENEVEKQIDLLLHMDDAQHVERYGAFENWFKHVQDIPGAFYLWIVEHLFRDNELIRGELEIGGERVDLGRITAPLNLLAGATDHITPPPQVFALENAVSTPAVDITQSTTSGGHLGLFMGREALREHWAPLMAGVYERSKPGARRGPAERRARETTPRRAGRKPIPAP